MENYPQDYPKSHNEDFSQDRHDKCDPPAREAVIKYIDKTLKPIYPGYKADHNPDKYGVDLLVYRDDLVWFYIEVYKKDPLNWWGDRSFPKSWKWVDFPIRKRKFLLLQPYPCTWAFIVSHNLTRALKVFCTKILPAPIYKKYNVEYYQIPIGDCKEILL